MALYERRDLVRPRGCPKRGRARASHGRVRARRLRRPRTRQVRLPVGPACTHRRRPDRAAFRDAAHGAFDRQGAEHRAARLGLALRAASGRAELRTRLDPSGRSGSRSYAPTARGSLGARPHPRDHTRLCRAARRGRRHSRPNEPRRRARRRRPFHSAPGQGVHHRPRS